ncbi:MAG: hypothetical protein RBU45_00395 [Myxococcota bacterium]|nr:hypothetical protein [Myxococcota bacterium]
MLVRSRGSRRRGPVLGGLLLLGGLLVGVSPVRSQPLPAASPPPPDAPRRLLLLPVLQQGTAEPALADLFTQLTAAGAGEGTTLLPPALLDWRLRELLWPPLPAGNDLARLRRLDDELEQGKEFFLINKFGAAVERLESVRQRCLPLLHRAAAQWPDFQGRFFHALMILGRSYEAQGSVDQAVEVYRWLIRANPRAVVDEKRYPPSLVRRYAAWRSEAAAVTTSLLVHLEGRAPLEPESCLVHLDGTARGGAGVPIAELVPGEYRLAVLCREGLRSRDYRLQLTASPAELRVFLGDDEPLRAGQEASPAGLELDGDWRAAEYLGPARAAARLVEADLVLLGGPRAGAPGLELILIDPASRVVLATRRLAAAEVPGDAAAARRLLAAMLGETTAAPPSGGDRAGSRWRAPALIAAGVALASWGGALGLGLKLGADEEEHQQCLDDYACRHRPGELGELRERAETDALLVNAALGVGTLATAAAVTFALLHWRSSTGRAEPTLGSGGALLLPWVATGPGQPQAGGILRIAY